MNSLLLVLQFVWVWKTFEKSWKKRRVFGRPFILQFAICCRTVVCPVCLSVLSVTLVYCGQMIGWIKMKLDLQVGIAPGHIVLDGDSAPPPPKGHSPPIFGPYLLRQNGCMDQDVTWYGARPRPMQLWARWGTRFPHQKGGGAPNFRPIFIVAKRLGGSRCHMARR